MPIADSPMFLCLLTFDVFVDEDHFAREKADATYQRWISMPFAPMENMDLQFTDPEETMTEVDSVAWMVDEGYWLVHCTDMIADGTDGDTPTRVHEVAVTTGWHRVRVGETLEKPKS